MINPFDTTTKTGMIVRGAEIFSNVGTFVLTIKNGAKLNTVKTNTEDIKMLNRQNISRTADINDLLRYYFPKPQQPQAQPVPPAVAPMAMGFTQPVVAQQPQPVSAPVATVAMPVQQPATPAVPQVNNIANAAPVQQPVPQAPVQAPAPQAPQQPQEQPQPQPQGTENK